MEKPNRRRVPTALLLAALWLHSAAAAPKKEPALAAAPPLPVEASVKVKRGESVEIPLRIYGKQHEALTYLIRVPPGHGKLSAPRVIEREISTVIYRPPADLAIVRDKFSFAVKSAAGVSAQVEVLISIFDEPARLAIPGRLDFPELLAGGTAVREFEIVNYGGGIAEGEIVVNAPWKIEGARHYRLGAAEKRAVKIFFAPVEGGSFEGEMSFSSHRENTTTVRGLARAPVAVAPAQLVLAHAAGEPVRAGAFVIANNTDEEKTVTLTGGARVLMQPEATLPAHGKATVIARTEAADVAPLAGEIRVAGGGYEARVAVQAAPVGAIFRASPQTIVFAPPEAKQPARAAFRVENIGGSPGAISVAIAEPFRAEPPSAELAAGESKTLALALPAGLRGRHRTWLTLAGGQQKIELRVEADLDALAPVRTRPAQLAAAAGTPAAPEPDAPEPDEPQARLPDWALEMLPVEGVAVREVKPAGALVSWPAALSDAAQFRVELRDLFVGEDGGLSWKWMEWRQAAIERQGDAVSARIAGLDPDQAYAARVLPLNASGEAGAQIFSVEFRTPPRAPILPKFNAMRACLVVLLLALGGILWLRQRERRAGV